VRCFLALELVDTCRERLRLRMLPFARTLQNEMRWPVRLVPPENWHATLLFFRDLTDAERAEVWQEVLRNVEAGVWDDLRLPWQGLVLWPNHRRPSLICLAAPPEPQAASWPITRRVGEPPFSKGEVAHLLAYRPHISLLRFQGAASRPYSKEWKALGDDLPQIPAVAIRFNRVSLFLSDVSAERPIYPREYTAPLKVSNFPDPVGSNRFALPDLPDLRDEGG